MVRKYLLRLSPSKVLCEIEVGLYKFKVKRYLVF